MTWVPNDVLRTSLAEILVRRGDDDSIAFRFVDFPAGIRTEYTLSWARLLRRVRAVAATLLEKANHGDRVAILLPQDLSYPVAFLGALYAGMVAVPLFEPARAIDRRRLSGPLVDSAATVWLGRSAGLDKLGELAESSKMDDVRLVDVERVSDVDSLDPVASDPARLAYLQYTSGSTRSPAGVMITHGALVASCWQASIAYGVDGSVTCAGWIPFFHDMGLVQLLCLPVFAGKGSVFMAPLEFVRRPERWLRMLSEHSTVFTAAPNFAFDLAVEAMDHAQRATLDLSGVLVALNGGEPVRSETIERFAEAFRRCGFDPLAHRPSYGLAEATVYVSSAGPEGPTVASFDKARLAGGRAEVATEGRALVSVGRPVGQRVRIVDPSSWTPLADGDVGEIWVSGPHVAAGYWRQPDKTRQTFGARIARATDGTPHDGWLRTGDLGVIHAGQLYITGRIKDLIVIAGRNHYPQDIEQTAAQAHPAIRGGLGAAFAVDDDGVEGVVVLMELVRGAETVAETEVARAVRGAVSAEHDVVVREFRLMSPGSVPRTSSGKVARSAARARFLAREAGGEH